MASKDVIDTLIAEAGGEGEAGLIAAAWAIQQRAAARGQTVDQVIKSGFDGYSNPGSGAKRAQQDTRLRAKVEQIMTGVQNGSIPNPVPGADHFLSGDVSPGWSKNMKHVATIGGHRFYASGNVPDHAYGPLIPPGELPSVGTLQDTRQPVVPPLPTTAAPNLAALRANTSPTGGNSDLQTALDRIATRERNRVTPASADERITARNRAWAPPAAQAPSGGLHPFDAARNTPRPNSDGSVSTEVSRTVQLPDGNWTNVPSLWWGDGETVRDFGSMGDDQLGAFAQNYEGKSDQRFPRYSTMQQAETAAQNRSNKGAGTAGPMTRPVLGPMGTPDTDALYKGIYPSSRPSLTAPGGVDAVVGGLQQDSGLAAALAARTAPQTRPALPMSYAGQERTPRPASRPVTPMSINVAQSYAGQERNPPRPAPAPAMPSPQLAGRRATDPVLQAALNSRYPARLPEIAPPAVGGPPTTRVVQSVPVRPSQSSGQGINAQRSEQAMTRQATPMPVPVPRAAQAPSDIGRMPSMAEMQATLGRPLSPSAVGGLYDNVFPNPLAPAGAPANPNADIGVATLLDTIDPRTGLRTAAPTGPLAYAMPPMPRSRPYAAMPSMPIPRPGIGGPYRVAPIPAPRTQRPGLFRLGGFELPQLPTQARTVAGRTAMFDAPVRQVFNSGGGQNTAAVQSYRDQGYSPSQAYDAANRAATERAISNARDPAAAARLNSR